QLLVDLRLVHLPQLTGTRIDDAGDADQWIIRRVNRRFAAFAEAFAFGDVAKLGSPHQLRRELVRRLAVQHLLDQRLIAADGLQPRRQRIAQRGALQILVDRRLRVELQFQRGKVRLSKFAQSFRVRLLRLVREAQECAGDGEQLTVERRTTFYVAE